MLEESICASPQRERRSVHKKWLARQNRSHQEHEKTNTSTKGSKELCVNTGKVERESSLLYNLYFDTNLSETSKSQNFNLMEFNVFEDLEDLAAADRLCTAQAQPKSQKLKHVANQEFKDCNKLLEEETITEDQLEELPQDNSKISGIEINNIQVDVSLPTKQNLDDFTNQEPVITETELLFCFEQVEEVVLKLNKSQMLHEETLQSPNSTKTKSIVELILDDFCSPPNRNSQSSATTENIDKTPTFLHKRKSLSTYSRRSLFVDKRNVAQKLENSAMVVHSIGKDIRDDCSGSIIQKQSTLQSDEAVSLNINNKYENSANLVRSISPHNVDEGISNASSNLSVQEEPALQPIKANAINMNNSLRLCENLQNLSTFFTQDSDIPSEVNYTPTTTQTENYLTPLEGRQDSDISREVHSTAIMTQADNYLTPLEGRQDSDVPSEVHSTAITPQAENYLTSLEGRQDTDIPREVHSTAITSQAKNYLTSLEGRQDSDTLTEVHSKATTTQAENYLTPLESTFYTKTMGIMRILEEIEIIRQCMEVNRQSFGFPDLDGFEERGGDINEELKAENYYGIAGSSENLSQISPVKKNLDTADNLFEDCEHEWNDDCEFFINYKTQKSCDKNIIAERGNVTKSDTLKSINLKTNIEEENSVHLLENIQFSEWIFDDLVVSEANVINQCDTNMAIISENKYQGFSTASNKNVKVSKEAQLRAQKILMDLPELPLEKIKKNPFDVASPSINNQCDTNMKITAEEKFQGFSTASNKNINISKEAQLRAQKILVDLPELPLERLKKNPFKVVSTPENAVTSTYTNLFPLKTSNNTSLDVQPGLSNASTLNKCLSDNADDFPNLLNTHAENRLTIPHSNAEFVNTNIGFQTASKKSITISEKAQAIASKILAELPDIPFTKETVKEQLDCVARESISLRSKTSGNLCNVNTNHDNIICKANVGFQTASKKNIAISKEAQDRANKILAELPDIPFTKATVKEQSECGSSRSIASKSKINGSLCVMDINYDNKIPKESVGFQTASKKNIAISKEAQDRANKILAELPGINGIPFNKEIRKEESNFMSTKNINSISKPNDENIDYSDKSSKSRVGFQTASKKNIEISKEARDRANKILTELSDLPYTDERTHNINEINNAINHESSDVINQPVINTENTSIAINTNMSLKANIGFQIVAKEPITISEEAQARVNKILLELSNVLYDDKRNGTQLKSTNKINCENYVDVEQNLNNITKESIYSKELLSYQKNVKKEDRLELLNNLVNGSQPKTNNNKIMQNLDTVEKNDSMILDKTKSATTRLGKTITEINTSKTTVILDEVESAVETIIQRKRDMECAERTPPQVVRKKTKTPNTRSASKKQKSNLSDLAVRSPLDSSQFSSIITRKNLLSLSRKRKRTDKPNVTDTEKDDVFETPNKKQNVMNVGLNTPGTPNLQEFYNSISGNASTPLNKIKTDATTTSKNVNIHKDTDLADDMQVIHWDNCNDETLNKSQSFGKTTKLTNTSLSNISSMEVNPTPQQRIERLNMYGKATTVSPIAMNSVHNCRPSGLRRNPKKTQFNFYN